MEAAILKRRPTMGAKGDNCSGPPDVKPNADPHGKTPANMTNMELWQAIAARQDLLGGDAVSEEDGSLYRGPLKTIEIVDGKYVQFTTVWSARKEEDSGEWVKHDSTMFFTEIESARPTFSGNGPVRFTMFLLGPVTLFPKGDHNLDPETVKGLRLAKQTA